MRPPTPPRRLRRLATGGAAAAALVAGALVPASHASPEPESLGSATDYGVTAPETAKLQDGALTGAEALPSAWFVELSGDARADGGSATALADQRADFLAEAESLGADLEVRADYDTLWNGLSVSAEERDVLLAAQSDQVVAVYPVYWTEVPVEPDAGMSPQMEHAVGMTGVEQAHDLGFTGEGLKIAVIDTGVDVDHPDFGGSGTPSDGLHSDWRTDRITYGYDLVGDDYNADPSSSAYNPVPSPDNNPDDCNGHGTHVASIAAGDGEVLGVAPDAQIGAYRVFGCGGSTTADVMLSAMELALEDGMDVVNMSIGSAFMTWPQYPTAVAGDALVGEGVVVVASIGNSGASGVYSAGAPGVGRDVIGVASFDNAMVTANAFTYGEDETQVPYFPATGAPEPPTEGSQPLMTVGAPGSDEARACTETGGITEDLTGHLVLLERGVCTFHEKAVNAQNAGADGVVMYNNAPGVISATVEGETPVTIPFVTTLQEDGIELYAAATAGEDGTVDITWTDELVSVPSPTAGLISSFSSYGLTAELDLKPDLGAPGGNIFAAYPLERGGFATLSGTSMSAPHTAGAVALLLQARPELATTQVRTVMQNHADPALWWGNPSLGYLEPVHRQGAGMIDVDDAILSTAMVAPGKLALGESQAGPHHVTLQVTNLGDDTVTYTVEHQGGVIGTSGATNAPGYFAAPASVTGDAGVTVAPGETRTLGLTITANPTAPDRSQYGGYIELVPDTEDADLLRVPYAGFAGDYQSVQVLTPGTIAGVEFPVLGQLTSCDRLIGYECAAGGGYDIFPDTGNGDEPVYSLVGGDVPVVLAHLEHQARALTMTAYRANADGSRGAELGEVRHDEYLSRSATAGGFSGFAWDGRFDGATVTDGKYLLEVEVLKALGDPDNPAHVETWQSEPFTIAAADTVDSPTVTRYEGVDRYATAARIANEYPAGVPTVYIATGADYPDALAAAARAGSKGVPVLLVKQDAVPSATRVALDRLDPQTITVLGDTASVSGAVVSTLRDYTDGSVTRVAGPDRYATAALLSEEITTTGGTVYVATGADYPDALAGAAAAGAVDGPVLLVKQTAIPSATRSALERLQPDTVVVLGDQASISNAVATQLAAYGEVERRAGDNRYETAAAVSLGANPDGADVAFVATGLDFPDALAGAARAGHLEGPVLLVRPDLIPSATLAELHRLEAGQVFILGDENAVSQAVQEQIAALTYGD